MGRGRGSLQCSRLISFAAGSLCGEGSKAAALEAMGGGTISRWDIVGDG